jgi:hypothetical protein
LIVARESGHHYFGLKVITICTNLENTKPFQELEIEDDLDDNEEVVYKSSMPNITVISL